MLDKTWKSTQRIAAIQKAIQLLKEYQGEEVVAYKHPLHTAIVELEGQVDDRMGSGYKQNKLFGAALTCWFTLLSSSRPDATNTIAPASLTDIPATVYHALHKAAKCSHRNRDPQLAQQWSTLLLIELESWLVDEPPNWQARLRMLERVERRQLHREEDARL